MEGERGVKGKGKRRWKEKGSEEREKKMKESEGVREGKVEKGEGE